MPQQYTAEGLERALNELRPFFDRVRIVEPEDTLDAALWRPR